MREKANDQVAELLVDTPYHLVGFLGRGGMGHVYVVEHELLGRRFALKLIHPHRASTPGLAQRMRLEARALGHLRHPHIVEVVDSWHSPEGLPCLLLELLQGRTLSATLHEQGALPVLKAAEVARQILLGLKAAHGHGIVHRDIKPANIFLHQKPGAASIVKILDFGLARVLAGPSGSALHPEVRTASGALVGSPRYLSPEAIECVRVDHRADLYNVGLLLYEMLYGEGPFDRGLGPPPSLVEHVPGVSAALEAVVVRALQEHRDQRFQSAADFLGALDAALPQARPTSFPWRRLP